MRFNFSISDSTKHFTVLSLCIVEVQRKILLVQDGSKAYHGRWSLPGLGSQTHERLERVAEHGLRSTVGLIAKVDSLVGAYHTYDEEAGSGTIIFGYSMKPPTGTLKIDESTTLLNAQWFHYNELFKMPVESLRFAAIRQIVRDYRRGRRYSTAVVQSF